MDTSFRLHPEQGSKYAGDVDQLYFFMLLVTAVMTIAIAAMILYFSIKYRRGSPASREGATTHSTWMEIVWIVGPLAVMLVMFYWGASKFFEGTVPPKRATVINVVGKQWMWKFQHPSGRIEVNTLHVPVGQPIRLNMISEDVIHSMFLPVFRVKNDVLPGRYTTTWFQGDKPGIYHIFCAEYCGTDHSRMGGELHVLTPAQYADWLAGDTGSQPPEKVGAELFERYGCNRCHRPTATGPQHGPPLEGLFGKQVRLVGGKTVTADEPYIRRSILRPQAEVVQGYNPGLMPTFEGQLGEQEILELIAYIKSLPRSSDVPPPKSETKSSEPKKTEPKNDEPKKAEPKDNAPPDDKPAENDS